MKQILPDRTIKILSKCGWQQCNICNTWCAIITNGVCGNKCLLVKNLDSSRTPYKGQKKNLIVADPITK
jgi:hypothetical protein